MMKVSGPGRAGPITGPAPGRRAADGFAPAGAGATAETSAASRAGAAGAVGSLDALLALQETGGPLERRRRAVRRADRLLDGLDGLRLAMIDGAPAASALERLLQAGREQREHTEDQGLESLLDQVDLRAAVELAKLDVRRAA